jgi:hypothetical protein
VPTPQTAADSDGNEISVLPASNRLQITADVDDKGEKLEHTRQVQRDFEDAAMKEATN